VPRHLSILGRQSAGNPPTPLGRILKLRPLIEMENFGQSADSRQWDKRRTNRQESRPASAIQRAGGVATAYSSAMQSGNDKPCVTDLALALAQRGASINRPVRIGRGHPLQLISAFRSGSCPAVSAVVFGACRCRQFATQMRLVSSAKALLFRASTCFQLRR